MVSDHSLGFVANDPAFGGTLLDVLRAEMARVDASDVRIATAFLSPDGFLALRHGLESAADVRMLLGERPFLTNRGPAEHLASDDEELADGPVEAAAWMDLLEGKIPWLLMNHEQRKALLEDDSAEFKEKLAFNIDAWEKVRALVNFLQREGVEMRRFLGDECDRVAEGRILARETAPRVHLHAKTYLFRGAETSLAAVGSSNLTKGGLEANVEANLISTDASVNESLELWFDAKWDKSRDCKGEYIRRLEECVLFGRKYRPWHVFLKTLHATYGSFLGLNLDASVSDRLADIQREGVARVIQLLDRHWGAMICDSVGFGKTYMGLGALKEYVLSKESAQKALVICPAQLLDNWSPEKMHDWGIPGTAVTMESLARLADLDQREDDLETRKLRRTMQQLQSADIVLVDESHNFRNPGTKRYRALMEIIRGGAKPDKRVLLLTATPINNSLWDLYHQLMLITRGDNSWYVGRGPVGNLQGTFKQLEREGGGAGLLDTMMLTLVRRTRHDIRHRIESGDPPKLGDKEMNFPEHRIPEAVGYDLSQVYGAGLYAGVTGAIEDLHFAVYNLEEYGIAKAGEERGEEEEQVIKRNRSFIGILRTTWLKRMESSLAAFRATVRNALLFLEKFEFFLQEGYVLRAPDAQRLRVMMGGSLDDGSLEDFEVGALSEEFLERLDRVSVGEYDHERLALHVAEDRSRLEDFLRKLDSQEMAQKGHDPKVEALRALIDSFPRTDRHGVPTKVVVFTNFFDTANHIFQALRADEAEEWPRCRSVTSRLAGGQRMSMLTGRDDRARRAEILKWFAPLSALRNDRDFDDPTLVEEIEPYRADPIDVVIATDVLSEGQNLQDAQYLINFDLHWNPVRMIQRAGRIDRLFSPHEEVFFYNIMPEAALEEMLGLVKRLNKKIGQIDGTVGLDASVLGEQITEKALDEIMAIKQGGESADRVYREGEKKQGLDDALDVLRGYLDMVRQMGTEEVQELPDGLYSVKEGEEDGVFLCLKMPEELGGQTFWRYYPLEGGESVRGLLEIVNQIAADREEGRYDKDDDTNPFSVLVGQDGAGPLRQAVKEIGQEFDQLVRAKDPGQLVKQVRRALEDEFVLESDEELSDKLADWCDQAHPDDLLRREGAVKDSYQALRSATDGPALLRALRGLWQVLEEKGLNREIPRPTRTKPTEEDLQLICWEWVRRGTKE